MVMIISQPLLYPPSVPTEGTESILIFIQLVIEVLRYPVGLGHVGSMRGYLAPLVFSFPTRGTPRALVRGRSFPVVDVRTGFFTDLRLGH